MIKGSQSRAVVDLLRIGKPKLTIKVSSVDQMKNVWQSTGTPVKGRFILSRSKSTKHISAGPG